MQEDRTMRAGLTTIVLLAATMLAGCVYGPDYGYVRSDGYYGDAYYGSSYYYPYYYGSYGYYSPYYYGYPSVGVSLYYSNRFHHRNGGFRGRGNWGRGYRHH